MEHHAIIFQYYSCCAQGGVLQKLVAWMHLGKQHLPWLYAKQGCLRSSAKNWSTLDESSSFGAFHDQSDRNDNRTHSSICLLDENSNGCTVPHNGLANQLTAGLQAQFLEAQSMESGPLRPPQMVRMARKKAQTIQ
jgi:hypothetical protein